MNSLAGRLGISFVLVALIGIGVIMLVIRNAVDDNFRDYLRQSATQESQGSIDRLETHYAQQGSWAGVESVLAPGRGGGGGNSGQGTGGDGSSARGAQFLVVDLDYRVVAATNETPIGTRIEDRDLLIALQHQGAIVGYLMRQTPGGEVLAQTEQSFLDDITHSMTLVAVGAGVLAAGLAVAIAWWVSRPIRKLTAGTQAVAAGQLGTAVVLDGPTEIRQLAATFNQMSAALAESEEARKQMISDIAHELRTPLSVIRGQLEGMMDGVFEAAPEQVAVVYNQVLHLARLVNDLWLLTRAEARILALDRESTDIAALLGAIVAEMRVLAEDAGIALHFDAQPDMQPLELDTGRIRQVFGNLLVNALRHVPAGRAVWVTAQQDATGTTVTVRDSGEGLPPKVADRIFERFYRADQSRQRDSGGAGLGLAIARELVQLHGGDIAVKSQPGQGTTFTICL